MTKKKISYIKKDEVREENISLLNRRKVLNTILKGGYEGDYYDVYQISEDIKYLEIENMTFYRGTKIFTPEDTIVVLKNCIFKNNKIDLIGGIIIIEEPVLDPAYYTNRFYVGDVKQLTFKISKDKISYLTIVGRAEILEIDATNRINRIGIKAKKISLKNIQELKSLDVSADEIYIEKSNINLETETGININTNDMEVKASNLSIENTLEINSINADRFEIDNSIIDFKSTISPGIILSGQELTLRNSSIVSDKNICIKYPRLTMDDQSKIQTDGQLILMHDIYKKKIGKEITTKKLKELEAYKKLISILKGQSKKRKLLRK